MRVLYCLDGTNVAEVSQARAMLSASEPQTLGILYVIDSGPREDIGRVRERFFRRPGPPPSREEEILQTERASAKDILEEGLRHLPDAEPLERQGRPEREIVNGAAEWRADLLVICPRSQYGGKPGLGPKSVGHVARFVLDHAPCPVLLVRPHTQEQFPIAR
jgi:nucleotide-binding universal stress UspA family protein